MAKALATFRDLVQRIKPWVAVAAVLAVGLVIYYGYQGSRWRSASEDITTYEDNIGLLRAEIQEAGPSRESLQQELSARKRLLEQWAGVFILERYKVTITDNRGTTSTGVAHVNIIGDAETRLDLDITPGVEYAFTVEHTGIARHYKLRTSHPDLEIGYSEVRYLGDAVQQWAIRAAEGETVRLQIATDSGNEGASQATEIGVEISDLETGDTLFGPTTTVLKLDSPQIISFRNTSTARKLRVRLEPDGHFRMSKVGGHERLYLLPCPQENRTPEPDEPSCAIGIFEGDDTHDWILVWSTTTPPEPGQAVLSVVASTADTFDEGSQSVSDQLLAILYATAEETGVLVDFTKVNKPITEADDLLEYESHTLDVRLKGNAHTDILRFLQELHRKMPGLRAGDPSLSGFGGTPTGNFKLRFFLAPERVTVEEKKKK